MYTHLKIFRTIQIAYLFYDECVSNLLKWVGIRMVGFIM